MPYTVSVDLHHVEIANFLYAPGSPVRRNWRNLGQKVQRVAIRKAPKDTGRMAASISVTVHNVPSALIATIGTGVHYALWVHQGTGVYAGRGPIRPRTGKYLRFKVGPSPRGLARRKPRSVVYATEVAGQPAQPFLTDALGAVLGGATRIRMLGKHVSRRAR
jgi:Bacteriophage HK97-gp10, putative tail-component